MRQRVLSRSRALTKAALAAAVLAPLLALAACSQAIPVGSVRTTGPLYFKGADAHGCTASVVSSPAHDLLITAAHCVFGTGVGMTFVPGSVNGSAPYGRWTVTAAFADPAWIGHQDPMRDVAFLRVARQQIGGRLKAVGEVTGGNRLVPTPRPIGAVVVPAYIAGVGGRPISCLAAAYRLGGYSAFDCRGYPDGVSGAPWIQGANVVGVIGGLHQGGCSPNTSYSPPFDAATIALYRTATKGGPGQTLPVPGSDGC